MQNPLIGQQIEGYLIREVALKALSAAMPRQPAFAERFQQEARTALSPGNYDLCLSRVGGMAND